MCNDYEKKLDFDSDTFEEMKNDMNFVLQRLIGNMQEKGTTEGSMTLKIEVTMVKEFIPNFDPEIKGETREVSKPQFKHKVTSAVKINDEKSGTFNNEMELQMDPDSGIYKLVPIANTSQRTIFDADFQQAADKSQGGDIIEGTAIEGDFQELDDPANTDTESTEEGGEEPGEGLEDITEELLGDNESENDDYGYEEPKDPGDE